MPLLAAKDLRKLLFSLLLIAVNYSYKWRVVGFGVSSLGNLAILANLLMRYT